MIKKKTKAKGEKSPVQIPASMPSAPMEKKVMVQKSVSVEMLNGKTKTFLPGVEYIGLSKEILKQLKTAGG